MSVNVSFCYSPFRRCSSRLYIAFRDCGIVVWSRETSPFSLLHFLRFCVFFLVLLLQYESDELEKSVYQDYDSDSDVADELKQDYVDEQTGDVPLKRSVPVCIMLRDCFYFPPRMTRR